MTNTFDKFEWLKQMVRDHSLTTTDRLTGSHLFNYAAPDGGRVRPGRARLSAELGISKSTVDRSLRSLRDAHWIRREVHGSSSGRANVADVYRLTISDIAVLATYEPVSTSDEWSQDQSAPVPSAPHQPVVNGDEWSGVTSQHQCVNQSALVRQPVSTSDDLTGHEHINQQTKSTFAQIDGAQGATTVSAPDGAPHKTDEDFIAFWDVFPNKRDRKRAYPAFVRAMTRASLDEIIAGAESYRDDPNRDLTAYAEKWLDGDRWEDAPIPAKPKAKSVMERSMDMIEVAREADRNDPSLDAWGFPALTVERDHRDIEAEVVEAPVAIEAPVPAVVVAEEEEPQTAVGAFMAAYPKRTPPAQVYGAQKAIQAAMRVHGERRMILAAERYTKFLKNEGTDPKFATKLEDWFKTDSFAQHLPHEFEPEVGMDVVAWLDKVTAARAIGIAKKYGTGDDFQPEWPGDMSGWTKADVDAFREADKDRWFAEHREMHLETLHRRYGAAPAVATIAPAEASQDDGDTTQTATATVTHMSPHSPKAPGKPNTGSPEHCTVCGQKMLLKSATGICSIRDGEHEMARSQLVAA